MKIKLAILDSDVCYLARIVSFFNEKYADKLEIHSFSEEAVALEALEKSRIDMFLAADEFEIDVEKLPKKCGFAYFVEKNDIETVRNQITISKYQKAEQIYKQLLGIYSEHAAGISGSRFSDHECSVIAFASPCGGVGTSTMAAACALRQNMLGKRVFYLNLCMYDAVDCFFSGEGQFDFSDIIYALKSKKTNIALKIESCVKQDASGVSFFSQPKVALDMMELEEEEIETLLSNLRLSGNYDVIVVDVKLDLSEKTIRLYERMDAIVTVSNGTDIANAKLMRMYDALTIKEQSMDYSILNRMMIVYNQFSNKGGAVLEHIGLKSLGGAPRYEHASVKQVVEQLAAKEFWNGIL